MSAPEQPAESRSSVKLTLNAKRDVQWEIKVYVGDSEADVQAARMVAQRTHEQLQREFGVIA